MSAPAPRYCQCGKRLAWDHAGALCGSCQRLSVAQRAQPPAVPPGFWDSPAFRDGFTPNTWAGLPGRTAATRSTPPLRPGRHPARISAAGLD